MENHVFLPERAAEEETLMMMKEHRAAQVATKKATVGHLGPQASRHVVPSEEISMPREPLLAQVSEGVLQAPVPD